MSALNGTKTRVVGFFKGLFGKGNSEQETVHDDAVYDYNQAAPVTGAQLQSPAAAVPVARPVASNHKSAATPHKNSNPAGVAATTAQPVARQNGNGYASGFSISAQDGGGHINGVVVTPKAVTAKPVAAPPVAPISMPAKPSNGNGSHAPTAPAPSPVPMPTGGKLINLPLAALAGVLPLELQPRLIKKNFADYTVAVPLDAILAQLPTGVVKIPFGVIRESAPQFFVPGTDADQVLVTAPLGEVLRVINPANLAKPANQVRIAADDDITSPFAEKGNNAKLEVKSSAPTRTITPSSVPTTPTPAAPIRHSLDEMPKPSAPTANVTPPVRINTPTPPATTPKPSGAATPATPSAPIAMPKLQAPASSPTAPTSPKPAPTPAAPIAMPKAQTPAAAPAPAHIPAAPPTPKINSAPSLRMVSPTSEPAAAPANPILPAPAPTSAPKVAPSPVASPAPVANPGSPQPTLTIALKSLVDDWPEAIKQELAEQNLINNSVDLPLDGIAAQLKNGRVAFTWDMIRSWMSPQPTTATAHSSTELELPLKVMAPAFLGLKNKGTAGNTQKVAADDCIPDVFAQASKAVVAPAPAPAPATVVALTQPAPEPVMMTPEAVVKRAASLSGVAGALVALPDGLVVASKLPAGQCADSLAAFLPQIFAKFDACLKDLKMDGLNNLNFTAGTVPWRVFRTSSVFFAVFGRANEPMPNDWLTTLAGELEKK